MFSFPSPPLFSSDRSQSHLSFALIPNYSYNPIKSLYLILASRSRSSLPPSPSHALSGRLFCLSILLLEPRCMRPSNLSQFITSFFLKLLTPASSLSCCPIVDSSILLYHTKNVTKWYKPVPSPFFFSSAVVSRYVALFNSNLSLVLQRMRQHDVDDVLQGGCPVRSKRR